MVLVAEGICFLAQKVGREVDHFAKLGEGAGEECLEALEEFDWAGVGKIPYLLLELEEQFHGKVLGALGEFDWVGKIPYLLFELEEQFHGKVLGEWKLVGLKFERFGYCLEVEEDFQETGNYGLHEELQE